MFFFYHLQQRQNRDYLQFKTSYFHCLLYYTLLWHFLHLQMSEIYHIKKQITTLPTKGWCNYFFSFLSFLKIIFTHTINHKQKYKTRRNNSATDNFTCSRNRKVDKITSLAFFDFLKDVFLGLCWNMKKKNVFTLYQADNFTNSFYWRPISFPGLIARLVKVKFLNTVTPSCHRYRPRE